MEPLIVLHSVLKVAQRLEGSITLNLMGSNIVWKLLVKTDGDLKTHTPSTHVLGGDFFFTVQ